MMLAESFGARIATVLHLLQLVPELIPEFAIDQRTALPKSGGRVLAVTEQ